MKFLKSLVVVIKMWMAIREWEIGHSDEGILFDCVFVMSMERRSMLLFLQ